MQRGYILYFERPLEKFEKLFQSLKTPWKNIAHAYLTNSSAYDKGTKKQDIAENCCS